MKRVVAFVVYKDDAGEPRPLGRSMLSIRIPNFKGRITMSREIAARWGWLKFMYIYTIVGAGGFGLGIITVPEVMKSVFSLPNGDSITLGIAGSVFLSFGLLAILGLRAPLKYVPILLLQLSYKVLWFVGVILPLLVAGRLPSYAIPIAIIFATYVIGDLIAIPFSYVLAKQADV